MDYEKAKGLLQPFSGEDRLDLPHHPLSLRIGKFIKKYNYYEDGDSLGLKFGGDGDSGEYILNALDVFFDYLEITGELQNGNLHRE